MPTLDLSRTFRSPDLRDLAKRAAAAGWDAYYSGGGHVLMVNPQNGARVSLSATAETGSGHGLANARRAFERAGLVLRQPKPEVPPMTQEPTPKPKPYAIVSRETVEIAGHQVTIAQRGLGDWWAETKWPEAIGGRRKWSHRTDRALMVERITADLASGVPMETRPGARVDRVREPSGRARPTVAPEPKPANGATVEWRAVGVDAADYPIAVTLDNLEALTAPALRAMESAGKTDAAALLRAELFMTPAEAELVKLWRELRGR